MDFRCGRRQDAPGVQIPGLPIRQSEGPAAPRRRAAVQEAYVGETRVHQRVPGERRGRAAAVHVGHDDGRTRSGASLRQHCLQGFRWRWRDYLHARIVPVGRI